MIDLPEPRWIPYNSALSILLGSYFSEDWPEDHGSPGRTVRHFRESNPDSYVDEARAELDAVLALPSEDDLEAAFDEGWCSYYIDPDETTIREFLSWMARALAEPLEAPPSEPGDWLLHQ
jgi:hypothetical protein